MKNILLTILLIGNPLTFGYFQAPTGETIWWHWFGSSLGVIDSNNQCVWNEGEPRACTITELSILISSINI
jgi:hypothetical protein